MNILRYFRVRRKEINKFYKLSKLIINKDSFSPDSVNKLNLIEISLLVSSFTKKDFSRKYDIYSQKIKKEFL